MGTIQLFRRSLDPLHYTVKESSEPLKALFPCHLSHLCRETVGAYCPLWLHFFTACWISASLTCSTGLPTPITRVLTVVCPIVQPSYLSWGHKPFTLIFPIATSPYLWSWGHILPHVISWTLPAPVCPPLHRCPTFLFLMLKGPPPENLLSLQLDNLMLLLNMRIEHK